MTANQTVLQAWAEVYLDHFCKWNNHGFATMSLSGERVHGVEINSQVKKKFLPQ